MKIEWYNLLMIEIFTTPSCRSCAKAIDWLKMHHIPYVEQNLEMALTDKKQIEKILLHTEKGFDSIVSTYSEVYKKLKVDFDNLKMGEALKIIADNPSIIKRPIILDVEHKNIEIGYNKDDIKIFALSADHHYKECPLSIEECRKKTRIKLFKEHFNIKDINDNKK